MNSGTYGTQPNPDVVEDNDCNGTIDDGLPEDQFEVNEACATGYELPELHEEAEEPMNIGGNLYKVNGNDEDWYKIHFKEATDLLPPCWDGIWPKDVCYLLAITLDQAEGTDQELCVKFGECANPDFEDCAGPGDEIDVGWPGSWLFSDDQDIYVQVKGAQSCKQYGIQITPYSICPNGGLCPWEEGYVPPE